MEWVSRITSVVVVMVLPGLAGHWLDAWLGTSFLALLGFGFGLVAGMWHLLTMTGAIKVGRPKTGRHEQSDSDESSPPQNDNL